MGLNGVDWTLMDTPTWNLWRTLFSNRLPSVSRLTFCACGVGSSGTIRLTRTKGRPTSWLATRSCVYSGMERNPTPSTLFFRRVFLVSLNLIWFSPPWFYFCISGPPPVPLALSLVSVGVCGLAPTPLSPLELPLKELNQGIWKTHFSLLKSD